MPVDWIPREYRRRYLGKACERCGLTAEVAKAVGLRLDLHHRDMDRTNNTPSNFMTLCAECHTATHWEMGKVTE